MRNAAGDLTHCVGVQLDVTERKQDALQRVLVNLFSNAVKFMPDGGVVTIAARAELPTGVRLSVTDRGVGIPDEELNGLFAPFARARHPAQLVAGTGLGLALVKEIVEAHGGAMAVDTELHRGSTFSFVIPTADAPQPSPDAVEQAGVA